MHVLTRSSWVFSSQLPSSEQTGHSLYSPSSSATKLSGYSWDISYGDGSSASGDVYRDTVTVGDVSTSKQAVEAASSVSSEFVEDTANDGLLGLAFSSINTGESSPTPSAFPSTNSVQSRPWLRPPSSTPSSRSSTLPSSLRT